MARLELAYVDVFDAPDLPPLAAARLAAIPPESLPQAQLLVASSVRLLEVDYPVADLRRRLRAENDEPVAIPQPAAQRLVVYRRELRLWDMSLSRVAFALLRVSRRSVAGLCRRARATSAEEESELAGNIGAWLAEWTAKA